MVGGWYKVKGLGDDEVANGKAEPEASCLIKEDSQARTGLRNVQNKEGEESQRGAVGFVGRKDY